MLGFTWVSENSNVLEIRVFLCQVHSFLMLRSTQPTRLRQTRGRRIKPNASGAFAI